MSGHGRTPTSRGPLPSLPTWVWLVVVAGAVGVGYLGRSLLIPLLLALVGAYFLNPFVLRLQERGISRSVSVLLLFSAFSLVLLVTVYLALPTLQTEGQRLVDEAPAFSGKLESALDRVAREVRADRPALGRFLPPEGEPGWLLRAIEEQSGELTAVAEEAGAILLFLVLAPVFAFFLLRDGPGVVDGIVGLIHPRHIETSVAVWAEIDAIIGRYLRGLVMESVGVGLLASLGLTFLGVPLPLLLGLFTAVVNPLPYIGVALSVGVSALVALTSGMNSGAIGSIIVLFLAIRLADDFILIPITIGGSVHLHPMLVIVSILVGEHALGVLGMVLAVPMVTVIKEVIRLLVEHRRTLSRTEVGWLVQAGSGHIPL